MTDKLQVAVANGDGIGAEIMSAALTIFNAAGVNEFLEFIPVEMSCSLFARGISNGITAEAREFIERSGLLFKGPMETPKGGGGKSINVTLRKLWSTFANLRPILTLPGVQTPFSKAGIPLRLVIVRENIEDTYGGIEHRLTGDTVVCRRLITAPGCDAVHRAAFEAARRYGITRVHCGHKANIMKMTDGLFLERFKEVATEFPDIETSDVIVDALCLNLVLRPQQYQMLVLPNLQGDIVSDLGAGLIGGLGFAPSANLGRHVSIFEAVHGTAPDIAGKDLANPTALLLSGLMLLRHVGLLRQAATIENALLRTLEEGVHTGDFSGASPALGTSAYAEAIIARLGKTPQTVSPLNLPEQQTPSYARGSVPSSPPIIRTETGVRSRIVGIDIFIETHESPSSSAKLAQQACQETPFALETVSNRGTLVWPKGSNLTECTDSSVLRLRLRDRAAETNQQACFEILSKVGQLFSISSFEMLKFFNDRPGFSLAQGE